MLLSPPTDVDIRIVTSLDGLDLPAIAALNMLAWDGAVNQAQVAAKARKLAGRFAACDGRQFLVAAAAGGSQVAFCRIVCPGGDLACWRLEGLMVHPDHRRRGVGAAVARYAIACAAARGATTVESQTHADNHVSAAFHERLGFRSDGPFTGDDGDRLLAFRLDLRAMESAQPAGTYDIDGHMGEIYDLHETQTGDMALLHRLIGADRPLRILEPFCGTGRILIPLALDGHELVGLDIAQAMLDRAAAKIAALPGDVGRRVRLVRTDAIADAWPGGFDLVLLGGNCFYELATPQQQEGCIASAADSLRPGGFLYVDNDHMEGDLHPSWRRVGVRRATRFPAEVCGDGTRMEGDAETLWFDAKARLWLARRGITVIFPDGRTIRREHIQQKHPVSFGEVAGWLGAHGLAIEQTFGDHAGDPYRPDSPRAIFWARKAAASD